MTTYWWKVDGSRQIVYTDDIKRAEKIIVEPWATYIAPKAKRVTAYQWLVNAGSKSWREVFDTLEIGNAEEEKRYSVKTNRKGEFVD